MSRPSIPKRAALTPEQRLMAAHMHIISGVDQHAIAGSYGVNAGRVAEAIAAIRLAITDPRGVVARNREADQ